MNAGFMHSHCLRIGKALLTLRACPVYFYWGAPTFNPTESKAACWNVSKCSRSSCVSCISIAAAPAVFILTIHLCLVVSLAWAIIWMSVGVTPTSSLASAPESLRTSSVQPLGASHWSIMRPRSQAALLSNTRFSRPKRLDETTC